jgi:benzoate-CoA ligase
MSDSATPGQASFDHTVSPPRWTFPRAYNAAHDLIERNLVAGRGAKLAYIDDAGSYSYGELAARVNRGANLLTDLGIPAESRIMLCLLDTIDYPTLFLGAIKAGLVPIATNTMLTAKDYAFMLADSQARALVVAEPLLPLFAPFLDRLPGLNHIVVAGADAHGHRRLADLLAPAGERFETVPTSVDDMCFWLYTSGSTGTPKGTVHLHGHMMCTAELYGSGVLGLREDDVGFSAPKLFFAYGLGNSLSFPLAVGATTILMAERPTPQAVYQRLKAHQPTVFYGVPTLYAALLAAPDAPSRADLKLRMSVSAGEALPADLGRRWRERFGSDILDGIGSTEMTHIYISNRPGDVRYGSSGKPVPGYQVKVADEHGVAVAPGEIGDLYVSGPTSALLYWRNRERTKETFQGPWTKSGDKYRVDDDGYYIYAGRSDDMLKVSGQYVSPFEVEAALMTHPDVLEAAVIGVPDENDLIKPKAYIVLKDARPGSVALGEALKEHVKAAVSAYKYPRWIEFMAELPKTATGKIQRYKLRELTTAKKG